eukprot:Nk52_evm8s533 gene=Nk52_evmTU8s533
MAAAANISLNPRLLFKHPRFLLLVSLLLVLVLIISLNGGLEEFSSSSSQRASNGGKKTNSPGDGTTPGNWKGASDINPQDLLGVVPWSLWAVGRGIMKDDKKGMGVKGGEDDFYVVAPFEIIGKELKNGDYPERLPICLQSLFKDKIDIGNIASVSVKWVECEEDRIRKKLPLYPDLTRKDNLGSLSRSPFPISDSALFARVLYSSNTRTGGLQIPEEFSGKVKGWLGGNEELYKAVLKQSTTSVFNRMTMENTVFNPLRGKRPGANSGAGGREEEQKYVDKLVDSVRESCDFCKATTMTAADLFGRVGEASSSGKQKEEMKHHPHAMSASNVFKYDAWHGLILFREHSPQQWSEEAFVDWMDTALDWFSTARHFQQLDENLRADTASKKGWGGMFRYPHLMWDVLPKASASQIHPHGQVSLTPDRYYGLGEMFRGTMRSFARMDLQGLVQEHLEAGAGSDSSNLSYDQDSFPAYDANKAGININKGNIASLNVPSKEENGRRKRILPNYFTALVRVHSLLGLSYQHGDAVVLAYITPKKEMELMCLCATASSLHFKTLLHHVLRSLLDDLGLYSFSLAMFFPEMIDEGEEGGDVVLPAVARVVDRGVPSSPRSDISAMELFGASNVNADPFELMRKLKPVLDKRLGS